jgi:hypothetical protein
MKSVAAAMLTLCALAGATRAAETKDAKDCKTLADPAARLTCYDKINPPVATYPIPLPKPSRPIPLTRPDGTPGSTDVSDSVADDPIVAAKMNGICRGC